MGLMYLRVVVKQNRVIPCVICSLLCNSNIS